MSPLDRLQYGFDRDSRRTWRRRNLAQGWDQHFGYDGLGQVTAVARGDLNLNLSAVAAVPQGGEQWDYDETGNWARYQTFESGEVTLDQPRVHDRGNRLMQVGAGAGAVRVDRAGRMTELPPDGLGDWTESLQVKYDAWGRVAQVSQGETVLGEYAYDGLSRRVTRTVDDVDWHCYYSDTWRPLEERRDADTAPSMQYYWGVRHRDDLVRRDRATETPGTLDEKRYVLMDYYSPASIADESGAVTERYAFSAFGVRQILAPDFTPRTESESAWEFAFQGQFEDAETGWLDYGYRYYVPWLGRWTEKDPIGERGGLNLYAMVGNDAVNRYDKLGLDPFGMDPSSGKSCCAKPDGSGATTYDPKLQCCIKGEVFSKAEQSTGVYRETAFGPYGNRTLPYHSWLQYPGGSAGFWPGALGKEYGEPGMVNSPDFYAMGLGSPAIECILEEEVKLSPCQYDIAKFVKCIQGYASKYPKNKQYNAGVFDCRHWSLFAILRCEESSKR